MTLRAFASLGFLALLGCEESPIRFGEVAYYARLDDDGACGASAVATDELLDNLRESFRIEPSTFRYTKYPDGASLVDSGVCGDRGSACIDAAGVHSTRSLDEHHIILWALSTKFPNADPLFSHGVAAALSCVAADEELDASWDWREFGNRRALDDLPSLAQAARLMLMLGRFASWSDLLTLSASTTRESLAAATMAMGIDLDAIWRTVPYAFVQACVPYRSCRAVPLEFAKYSFSANCGVPPELVLPTSIVQTEVASRTGVAIRTDSPNLSFQACEGVGGASFVSGIRPGESSGTVESWTQLYAASHALLVDYRDGEPASPDFDLELRELSASHERGCSARRDRLPEGRVVRLVLEPNDDTYFGLELPRRGNLHVRQEVPSYSPVVVSWCRRCESGTVDECVSPARLHDPDIDSFEGVSDGILRVSMVEPGPRVVVLRLEVD